MNLKTLHQKMTASLAHDEQEAAIVRLWFEELGGPSLLFGVLELFHPSVAADITWLDAPDNRHVKNLLTIISHVLAEACDGMPAVQKQCLDKLSLVLDFMTDMDSLDVLRVMRATIHDNKALRLQLTEEHIAKVCCSLASGARLHGIPEAKFVLALQGLVATVDPITGEKSNFSPFLQAVVVDQLMQPLVFEVALQSTFATQNLEEMIDLKEYESPR